MFKKLTAFVFAALVGLLGLAAPAFAALDPAIATAFTAVKDDATSLNAIVLPIVIALLGYVIVLKLIKRFGNKI